ncbi:hypothetical protein NIA71_01175 [Ihubacter massiliensis]|uniref:hypothetical protein n=1 Tax=Ihubacter massiliensis TaxID=1852367 RepID=UPI0020984197|nr:hypothetical protein [Ihubacter massiliensis]MCI7301294.1 hypothetical protein [Clostridia bacterium]MCO7120566.1 hypothetical protein [Ihubacter massiliensis]MDY3010627.1 hypothetical protein [Clostridiales Family XIII bacterium]
MSFDKNDYILKTEYTTDTGTTIKLYMPSDDQDGERTKEGMTKAMQETAAKLLSKYY